MKKNKHDHKGTKILKLGIFSTLMLAPFMAVLFKCAYVTFNKNAKDSYGDNLSIQTSLNYNSVVGNTYIINWVDNTQGMTNNTTAILPFQTISLNNTPTGAVAFRYGQSKRISFYDANNTQLSYLENITNFTYIANDNTTLATQPWFNRQLVIYAKGTLDNAFYYAIDEAMESPYFAWARTSALYTATSGLTTGMGITTQAVPTLIVYWLILTLIYIVLDIVIELFTFLTHNFMQRTE